MANTNETLTGLFSAIANSIRAKKGTAASIPASDFPSEIGSIVTLGEGSADGNAAAEEILSGRAAYVKGAKVIGAMVNNGAVSKTLGAGDTYIIPKGYHNGSGKVNAENLPDQTGTAVAGDVLDGKTAYVNGLKITGTMPNNGAVSGALNAGGTFTIPAGYHNGSGKVVANSLASQTDGTAESGDILSGKTAYVDGAKVTGAMVNNGAVSKTIEAGESFAIPAGYHNGSGVVVAAQSGNIVSSGGVATQWSAKMDKMLSPVLTNTSAAITVKAMCYYDGYWYGIANDSAGDLWALYGLTTGSLAVRKFIADRYYPATGITCDGTDVHISTEAGSYSDRLWLRAPVDVFRGDTAGTYSARAYIADFYTVDMFTTDTYNYAVGGHVSKGSATIFSAPRSEDASVVRSSIDGVGENYVSGCAYMGKPAAVTAGGIVAFWDTDAVAAAANMSYKKWDGLLGAQKIRVMGGYLCVASTREDGTYLSYTSGDPVNDGFTTFKITDEVLTVVGMVYANGVYTLVGRDGNDACKVWQSDSMASCGFYGRSVPITSGFTARTMATDGTKICLLADNGSYVQAAVSTIS